MIKIIVAIIVVVGLGLIFVAGNSEAPVPEVLEDNTLNQEVVDGDNLTVGSYESYSPEKLLLADSSKVVLFFRASWCPTCRGLDADIRANLEKIPAGVVILDVDYDNSTPLKQKYGVTYQHTLVQVDASGTQIAKWQGSPTLTSLVSSIK